MLNTNDGAASKELTCKVLNPEDVQYNYKDRVLSKTKAVAQYVSNNADKSEGSSFDDEAAEMANFSPLEKVDEEYKMAKLLKPASNNTLA